jgi:hypothetical protein
MLTVGLVGRARFGIGDTVTTATRTGQNTKRPIPTSGMGLLLGLRLSWLGQAVRRTLRLSSNSRSDSESPPQMPYGSPTASAWERH